MSTTASHREIFPFLKLPTEIRLKIYKYALDMAKDNKIIFRLTTNPYTSVTTTCSTSTSNDHIAHYNAGGNATRLSPTSLRARFATIQKLGSICQRIRSEA
ncbi:hypothetical protein B0T20DRAFT_479339 [Sordaria brevicollis]|uniref:2EXR domain-containing protein n=1 Tax=Sordaria brevicollis TaxID=83679 RepID=A0AAE0PEP4_SORBR|nr:hypothetical protein B0T20DRAFT_479339 [Sordaria brevicollis]